MNPAARRLGVHGPFLFSLLLLLLGCSRSPELPDFPINDSSVLILASVEEASAVEVELIRELCPDAEWVSPADGPAVRERALRDALLIVVPATNRLDPEDHAAWSAWLKNGGRALFIGTQFFEGPSADAWAEQAVAGTPFSAVQLWLHDFSDPAGRGVVRVAKSGRMPWPGVEVDVPQLSEWDRMTAREIPEALSAGTMDTLVFYAKGDARTTRLAVRAMDRDGTSWTVVVPVSPRWELVSIPPQRWRPDSGETASWDWSRVESLSLGMDQERAPQLPGKHAYGLSDIRLARAPALDDTAQDRAPWVADPRVRYAPDGHRARGDHTRVVVRLGSTPVSALRPQPNRFGPAAIDTGRWVSLYHMMDRSGETGDSLAGLYLRRGANGEQENWAWIGLDITRSHRRALRAMMHESLFRLQRGRYLLGGGIDGFVLVPGDFLKVQAQVLSMDPLPGWARVTAEWLDPSGQILRRAVSSPLSMDSTNAAAGPEPVQLNIGTLPAAPDGEVDHLLRLTLDEVGGGEVIYDRVDQPIKVLTENPPVAESEFPSVSGARIALGRVPLFFLGVDYDPGWLLAEGETWLQSACFDPLRVRRDLDELRRAGFNTITLRVQGTNEYTQVRYVVEEAQQRGFWIILRMPNLLSAEVDETDLRQIAERLALRSEPSIFAVDLGSEINPGRTGSRDEWDQRWTAWLIEQWGDLEAARNRLGTYAGVDSDARHARMPEVGAWPDGAETEQAWRVYRRFANDWLSRRTGYVVRMMRKAGWPQLITLRAQVEQDVAPKSSGLWVPVPPGAAAVHLDYLTVGADLDRLTEESFLDAGFLAAYARGMGDGKPVIWSGLGADVGTEPHAADYENQARVVRTGFGLAFATHSVGGLVRAFASDGGMDDDGLVEPDRSWRPVMEACRSLSNQLRNYRLTPSPWNCRKVAPPSGRRGLMSRWDDWRTVYRSELMAGRMEEIRPEGYERRSEEEGGGDAWFNAEWGHVEMDRVSESRAPGEIVAMKSHQLLRVELINTGPAIWSAAQVRKDQTVWVEVRHETRRPQYLEVPTLAHGRTIWIEWQPADAGTYTLRPFLLGVGGFGESITVEVTE